MSPMITLVLTTPGAAVGFVALAVGLLEVERRWTATCRHHDRKPGFVAYPLDALALLALVCAIINVVGTLLPVVQAFVTHLPTLAAPVAASPAPVGIAVVFIFGLILAFVIGSRMRRQRTLATANESKTADLPVELGSATQLTPVWNTEGAAAMVPVRQGGRITSMVPAPPASFLDMPKPPAPPVEIQRNVRQIGFVAFLSLGLAATAITLVISSNVQFQQQTGTFMTELRAQIARQAEQTALFSNAVRESNQPASVVVTTVVATPQPGDPQPVLERKRVSGDILNLRAAPGAGQPILARLQRGTEVELMGDKVVLEDATWVRIRIGAAEGWVSSTFLE